jgi:hypothetical protein
MAESIIAGRGTTGTVSTNISGGSAGLGRDFLDITNAVTAAKTLTRVEILLNSTTDLVLKVKVFRPNGANYDFIGGSQEFTGLTPTSVNNLVLNTSISVLVGDLICIHSDPVGSQNISVSSGGSVKYDSSGSDYEANILQSVVSSIISYALMYSAFGDDAATAPDPVLTISTPTINNRAKQRNASNQAARTITGSIADLPAGAIVRYKLGAGEYQTLDASPTSTFSGTVTVTATQIVTVDVYSDSVSYSSQDITLHAVESIITSSQSNGDGRLFSNQTFTLDTGAKTPLMIRDGVLSTLSDPSGSSTADGSIWPLYISKLANANPDIVYLMNNTSQGGVSVDRWLKTASDLYPRLTAANTQLGGLGFNHMILGETDSNNDMPEAESITKYGQLINDIKTDFGIDTWLTNFPKLNYSGNDAMRNAFAYLVANNSSCFDGGDLRPLDIANTGGDGIHIQTDDQGAQAAQIMFNAREGVNTTPIANAEADQTNITAGATVTLDGSGSSDADSDAITYLWTQTAGDTVTLSSTTPISPTFTAPSTNAGQTLTFSLVVNDGTDNSTADTVNIGVLAQVVEVSALITEVSKTLFSINSNLLPVFSGRANIETINFTPVETFELMTVDADGYFDFTENEVSKVKVIAGGKTISTDTNAVSFESGDLNIELGALNLATGTYTASIVIYVGTETKGIVFVGAGLSANLMLAFHASY